jgi:hypothetical protein
LQPTTALVGAVEAAVGAYAVAGARALSLQHGDRWRE